VAFTALSAGSAASESLIAKRNIAPDWNLTLVVVVELYAAWTFQRPSATPFRLGSAPPSMAPSLVNWIPWPPPSH
jgi:hypothetical protein